MNNQTLSMRADHVALRVANFAETLSWYKEKLGFKEEVVWTVEELLGMQLAYLEHNGFRLEIIGGGGFQPTQTLPASFQEALDIPGYGHLCFEVEDIDAVLAELEQRGVPTFVPAATYPLSNYWRRVGFVLDNSGNVIEFAESLTTLPPTK